MFEQIRYGKEERKMGKYEEAKENEISGYHSNDEFDTLEHDHQELSPGINPISNIDIERIGSPNKPKGESIAGISIKKELKDSRHKLDDEEDESIITGSHTVSRENKQQMKTHTMTDYLESNQAMMDEKDAGGYQRYYQ